MQLLFFFFDYIIYQHLENKAPLFRETAIQEAFKGQKWRFEVPVSDPEKQPIYFEFLDNSHGMEISSEGVITWVPSEERCTRFLSKSLILVESLLQKNSKWKQNYVTVKG